MTFDCLLKVSSETVRLSHSPELLHPHPVRCSRSEFLGKKKSSLNFSLCKLLLPSFRSGDGLSLDSDVVNNRNIHHDFPVVGVWLFLLLEVSEGSEASLGAFIRAGLHLGGW